MGQWLVVHSIHCKGLRAPRAPHWGIALDPKYVYGQSRAFLQGAAAGPLHSRAGALPLDPKWRLSHGECQMYMPLVDR